MVPRGCRTEQPPPSFALCFSETNVFTFWKEKNMFSPWQSVFTVAERASDRACLPRPWHPGVTAPVTAQWSLTAPQLTSTDESSLYIFLRGKAGQPVCEVIETESAVVINEGKGRKEGQEERKEEREWSYGGRMDVKTENRRKRAAEWSLKVMYFIFSSSEWLVKTETSRFICCFQRPSEKSPKLPFKPLWSVEDSLHKCNHIVSWVTYYRLKVPEFLPFFCQSVYKRSFQDF